MTTAIEQPLPEDFFVEGDQIPDTPCRRGLSMMEELRSQVSQRNESELLQGNPFSSIKSDKYKDILGLFDDVELQGMLMMFNYLHNHCCGDDEDLIRHSKDNSTADHLLRLLDDLRNYIQIRMHPIQDLYLSTDLFENCDSAYDLRMKLGDKRLKGALTVFNILHPEEVKVGGSAPISFTLFYGPPPRSAHTPSRTRATPSRTTATPSSSSSTQGSRSPVRSTPQSAARSSTRTPLRSSAPRNVPSTPTARALFTL